MSSVTEMRYGEVTPEWEQQVEQDAANKVWRTIDDELIPYSELSEEDFREIYGTIAKSKGMGYRGAKCLHLPGMGEEAIRRYQERTRDGKWRYVGDA